MHLTNNLFEQNLNTKFWLYNAEGSRAAVDLVEVKNGHAPGPYEVFTLLFRGDLEKIYPQRTYLVEHDAIGTFDLFLVPVARETNGIIYEAVFNRLSDQE